MIILISNKKSVQISPKTRKMERLNNLIYKLLSLSISTQSRDRTGTDRSTGVWDQRVYQFRHLGLDHFLDDKGSVLFRICKFVPRKSIDLSIIFLSTSFKAYTRWDHSLITFPLSSCAKTWRTPVLFRLPSLTIPDRASPYLHTHIRTAIFFLPSCRPVRHFSKFSTILQPNNSLNSLNTHTQDNYLLNPETEENKRNKLLQSVQRARFLHFYLSDLQICPW